MEDGFCGCATDRGIGLSGQELKTAQGSSVLSTNVQSELHVGDLDGNSRNGTSTLNARRKQPK